MEVLVLVGLVAVVVYWVKKSREQRHASKNSLGGPYKASDQRDKSVGDDVSQDNDFENIEIEIMGRGSGLQEQVVEVIGPDGVPAFKYRFRAFLDFKTPISALDKNGIEEFIPRPNGNTDIIDDVGGMWSHVNRFENPEWRDQAENKRFKYIGGMSAYIDFLRSIREVYEDRALAPSAKRGRIERICNDNWNVYTVRHVYTPPWEELLIPAISLADGFGQHRTSLLLDSGVRTIGDIDARSDKELLEVKGIGKAAVSSLRTLSDNWRHDRLTEYIERDEDLRSLVR